MGALDPFRFRERHPSAHLVFGEYDNTQAKLERPSRLQVIMRLIKRLDLTGDWSGVDKRGEGRFELLLSDAYDAKRIGGGADGTGNGEVSGLPVSAFIHVRSADVVEIARCR